MQIKHSQVVFNINTFSGSLWSEALRAKAKIQEETLRIENKQLKERIEELEKENKRLRILTTQKSTKNENYEYIFNEIRETREKEIEHKKNVEQRENDKKKIYKQFNEFEDLLSEKITSQCNEFEDLLSAKVTSEAEALMNWFKAYGDFLCSEEEQKRNHEKWAKDKKKFYKQCYKFEDLLSAYNKATSQKNELVHPMCDDNFWFNL